MQARIHIRCDRRLLLLLPLWFGLHNATLAAGPRAHPWRRQQPRCVTCCVLQPHASRLILSATNSSDQIHYTYCKPQTTQMFNGHATLLSACTSRCSCIPHIEPLNPTLLTQSSCQKFRQACCNVVDLNSCTQASKRPSRILARLWPKPGAIVALPTRRSPSR